MARPRKTGLDYFPFDVNFFSDKKIKRLRAKYGCDGICVYLYVLCLIYGDKGYYAEYDEDLILDISDELNISENSTKQIMKYLFGRSLLCEIKDSKLAESVTVITAKSVQRRFQEAKKSGKSDVFVRAGYWLLEKAETLDLIKVHPKTGFSENNGSFSEKNPSKSEKNAAKESKVKKSKGKERREAAAPPIAPSITEVSEYIRQKGYRTFTAERFCSYYDSVGWIRNREPITDWRSLADSWEANEYGNSAAAVPDTSKPRRSSFDIDELESLSSFYD